MERSTIVRGCGIAAGIAGALALGGAVLSCAGVWGVGTVMNAGSVAVEEIGPAWTVRIRGEEDSATGSASALAAAIETRCHPMSNGLRVLFSHAWYNAVTSGYDAQIWIEDRERYDEYALYIWGNHAFLRDEVGRGGYVNRVLTCDLDADEWLEIARAPSLPPGLVPGA
jgi:hypothetical protein